MREGGRGGRRREPTIDEVDIIVLFISLPIQLWSSQPEPRNGVLQVWLHPPSPCLLQVDLRGGLQRQQEYVGLALGPLPLEIWAFLLCCSYFSMDSCIVQFGMVCIVGVITEPCIVGMEGGGGGGVLLESHQTHGAMNSLVRSMLSSVLVNTSLLAVLRTTTTSIVAGATGEQCPAGALPSLPSPPLPSPPSLPPSLPASLPHSLPPHPPTLPPSPSTLPPH